MSELIKQRFYKIINGNRCILFDVQTCRVYTVDITNADIVKQAEAIIQENEKERNENLLSTIGYEEGSNLAINVNLTPACNLKCVYCFAQGGDYGGINKVMGEDITEKLEFIVENYKTSSNKVRIEFFGGEPLLNIKTIHKIIRFCNEYSSRTGTEFVNRISTNLTYVNEETIDVLGQNNFTISVSIDGGKEVQDKLRPFKNGEGSFDIIMENTRMIREKYPNIVMVARMTVAQKETALIDNIFALLGTNYFDYVSIYPSSIKDEKNDSGKYQYYFDNDIKAQFKEVINNYQCFFEYSERFKGILEYEKIYDSILNGKLSISHCSAGGTYFTLSGDETVVPCHRVCGKDSFILNKEKDWDKNIIREWSRKVDEHLLCSECWARYICGGGCKQEHLSANGSIKKVNSSSCEYHKFIIESLIKKLTEFSEDFNMRKINVDDLFVYCGRPTAFNNRNQSLGYINKARGLKVFGS